MRCLIVDDVHPVLITSLRQEGIQVDYCPDYVRTDAEQVIDQYQILILRSKFRVDKAFLELAKDLRYIGRAGAGLDNVDARQCSARGVELIHAAEGNADAVAEHTIAFILVMLNNLWMAGQSIKDGRWDREAFRGLELKEKTVGILGYGNMGRAVAKRLYGFGCRVMAYDKYLTTWPDEFATRATLEQLQTETDILSIHLPLTAETQSWVDATFLRTFKTGLFLVNTARGGILPIEGLIPLLQDGTIAFAALDVLETEPPTASDQKILSIYETLFSLPNVVLSPHVAGWSLESYRKISEVLATKILHQINRVKN